MEAEAAFVSAVMVVAASAIVLMAVIEVRAVHMMAGTRTAEKEGAGRVRRVATKETFGVTLLVTSAAKAMAGTLGSNA